MSRRVNSYYDSQSNSKISQTNELERTYQPSSNYQSNSHYPLKDIHKYSQRASGNKSSKYSGKKKKSFRSEQQESRKTKKSQGYKHNSKLQESTDLVESDYDRYLRERYPGMGSNQDQSHQSSYLTSNLCSGQSHYTKNTVLAYFSSRLNIL